MSNLKIKKRELLSLIKSFKYAFTGLIYCIHNERNMRIHLALASCVTVFAFFYKTTTIEFAILTIVYSIVIVTEMVNTAIEVIVNLQSPSYHVLAKIAKDVAAAAVLISSIAAVIIGITIFSDLTRLNTALTTIILNPYILIFFIILIFLAILFIFKGYKLVYKLIKYFNN